MIGKLSLTIRLGALLLAWLFTAAAGAQDRPADLVAITVLNGFVQQDVAAIQQVSTALNADLLQRILDGTANADPLFGRDRATAARQWDGTLLPARYERYVAFVPFAINGPNGPAPLASGVDGPYLVVRLQLEGTDTPTWRYADIGLFPRASYENRSAEPL